MTKVSAGWADKVRAKTGHNAHDSKCVRWRGDFAGVNLKAKCTICNN